jgi:poly-gamma-glutamate capsule biosynthesis protein CapA/YwtB (metallophosphatase superfamily)
LFVWQTIILLIKARGINGTIRYLNKAGIESFGLGETPQTAAAKPLLVKTPMGIIGVTGMSQLYYYGEPPGRAQVVGVIELQNEDTTALAVELLHASGADLKVAFVHWGSNYVSWMPKMTS